MKRPAPSAIEDIARGRRGDAAGRIGASGQALGALRVLADTYDLIVQHLPLRDVERVLNYVKARVQSGHVSLLSRPEFHDSNHDAPPA
jgi:hypothetical protein